jgi:hypothetical protein
MITETDDGGQVQRGGRTEYRKRSRHQHYLIIWGTAVHAIRSGDGTPFEAAFEAFGVKPSEIRALKTMTWLPVTMDMMRSDIKRTKACIYLMEAHKSRAASVAGNAGPDALEVSLQRHIDDLTRQWKSEWDRYENTYGKLPPIPGIFFTGSEFKEVPVK